MTRPYFMRSERLGFGLWTPDDLPLALGLWGDSRVTRLIGGPFSEQQVRQRLDREVANQEAHGFQYWPIFRLIDDEHVGSCGLRPYAGAEGILEFGFQLMFAFWGQGYGWEAGETVIRHAFGALGARGLTAGHHPENEASKRLLCRLGFVRSGEEFYAPTGLVHPLYTFSEAPRAGG